MNRFYRRICDIEVLLAMILLGISVSIIFIAAILRTAGHPIRWGNDIALMLFAWSTFTSADIVSVSYTHLRQKVFLRTLCLIH